MSHTTTQEYYTEQHESDHAADNAGVRTPARRLRGYRETVSEYPVSERSWKSRAATT